MPENDLPLIDRSLEKLEEVLHEDNVAESLTGTLAWSGKLKQEGLPELSSQNQNKLLLLVIYSGTLLNKILLLLLLLVITNFFF